MTIQQSASPGVAETLYCANHPDVETLLRCNRCGKPICTKCAVLTDVGYRCRECIRQVQDVYYNAEQKDNVIALVVGFVVAFVATPILGFFLGFFGLFFGTILAFVLGSGAGTSLAQIIRRAVGRRRGRYLGYFAVAGIALGVGAAVLVLGGIFPLLNIQTLVFGVLAVSTAYPFLR